MYLHAWSVPREIDLEQWEPLRRDAIAVLQAVSARLERGNPPDAPAILRGPAGMGGLVILPDRLAFNGNSFRNETGDAFVLERVAERGYLLRANGADPVPAKDAAPERRADESGRERVLRRAFRRCDTGGHPYDLAVCAVLLTALWHLGDEMRLGTQGSIRTEQWRAAADIVRAVLGIDAHLTQNEYGTIRWRDAALGTATRTGRSAS